jgi:hypothetical protein
MLNLIEFGKPVVGTYFQQGLMQQWLGVCIPWKLKAGKFKANVRICQNHYIKLWCVQSCNMDNAPLKCAWGIPLAAFKNADVRDNYDFNAFKEMIGPKALRQINDGIQKALIDPNCVSRDSDGMYKVIVKIDELDTTSVYMHNTERYYFQRKYDNTCGIPFKHLMALIDEVPNLRLLRIDTKNLSEMYQMKFQDMFCTKDGLLCIMVCCCLPLLCMTCRSRTLKPYHIDVVFTLWYKKDDVAIGVSV